jgi:LPXTG-motif cell wall-anchored protein
MLGYLNGLGKPKRSSGSTTKKTILKKAFAVLPPVMAIKVAKKIIASNKNKPRAASQNTQMRALKNAVAQQKAKVFVKKNKALFLDDADLNQVPATEENIIDSQIDQEVENEIEMEEEFSDEQADLGIYYPTMISGKADRKAKKQAKIEKKKSKTDLRKAKAEAKVNKSKKDKKSGKDIFKDVLDSAKSGLAVYKDFKGGTTKEGDETLPTDNSKENESFMSKNKTLLILGGVAVLGGAFLLLRKKK